VLAFDVSDFAVEFKDGSVKNVGAANKRATAKLFDVTGVAARPYGSDRVKLVFEDDAGDEVQVALSPDQAEQVAADVRGLTGDDASED
jgi:hypothetical protein